MIFVVLFGCKGAPIRHKPYFVIQERASFTSLQSCLVAEDIRYGIYSQPSLALLLLV